MPTSGTALLKRAAISTLSVYRNILSPFMLPSCRFFPSCSAYAQEAVERYGSLRGTVRALKRLLRCHPFSRGGADPVA